MALTIITLVVPPTNGIGPAVDVHLLDAQKSFALDGTLGPNEQLLVEITEDPAGLIGFTGFTFWDAGNVRNVTLPLVAAFARIRRNGASGTPPSSTPTASVSGTQTGINSYFNLPVPLTSGVGAGVDVSTGGQAASFSIHDGGVGFGPGEALALEGSNDNVSFVGIVGFTSKTAPGFYPLSYKYLRVRRLYSSGVAMSFFVGTSTSGVGGGGGGNNEISGLDISAMTGGDGTIGWISYPGIAEPTDNLAPNSSHAAGVLLGGSLITSGPISAVKFTTDGGKPANSAPIYLAAASDDGNTGAGKLTSARPAASVSGDVQNFNGTFSKCIVRVGTVINNSLYDSAKTCDIIFEGSTPEPQVPSLDMQFVGSRLGPFSAVDYLTAPFNAIGATLKDGESLVVGFTVDAIYSGIGTVISNFDGTNGWLLTASTNMEFVQYNGGVATTLNMGLPKTGLNVAVLSVHDGKIWASLNGKFTSIVSAVTNPSSGVLQFGGLGGASPWNNGDLVFVNKYARIFEPAEMIQLAQSQVFPSPPKNRFILSDAYNYDQSLQYKWIPNFGVNLYNAANAVVTTMTKVGAPANSEITEGWYRNLASKFLDTEPTYYDSSGIPRPSASSRLSFTMPALNQDICVGIWGLNHSNWDQEAIGLSIDGVFQGAVLPPPVTTPVGQVPDNQIHYCWISLSPTTNAAAPHDIRIIGSSSLQIALSMAAVGAYVVEVVAGQQQVFDVETINKRFLFVGYDNASAQDAASGVNPQDAAVTKIRAGFPTAGGPGAVTSESSVTRSLFNMYKAGGNSIAPFAHRIITDGLEANPSTVLVYISLVFRDYIDSIPSWSPAAFAIQAGALVDFIHSIKPSWIIYYQKAAESQFDAIANANGDTLAAFNAAVDGLASGRPWLIIVNARVPGAIAFQFAAPQSVMSPAGIVTYVANIKAAISY